MHFGIARLLLSTPLHFPLKSRRALGNERLLSSGHRCVTALSWAGSLHSRNSYDSFPPLVDVTFHPLDRWERSRPVAIHLAMSG